MSNVRSKEVFKYIVNVDSDNSSTSIIGFLY